MCCGNGLRPEVWNGFKERFRIPQILEFYAATEGNVSLVNVEGMPGAIGRIPPFLAHRFPAALVKFDVEADAPVRDARGFCVRCAPNEVGEAIGRAAERPIERRQPVRGLHQRGRDGTEDPARRVRAGRRVVPNRRSDAPGRARLLLFRRSDRRHVPLEGRERRHLRGVGGDLPVSRDHGSRRLRRDDSGRRRPGRHGRSRRPTAGSISPHSGRIWSTACPIMRARCSCASATTWT